MEMSFVAYSIALILMRFGLLWPVMGQMVQAWTSCCHSRYYQKMAKLQYLPAASRLEALQVMPMGVHGMRWKIGQDFGIVFCKRVCFDEAEVTCSAAVHVVLKPAVMQVAHAMVPVQKVCCL